LSRLLSRHGEAQFETQQVGLSWKRSTSRRGARLH
jgi:hypothetical protein